MPCYKPVTCWRSKVANESGKYPVIFDDQDPRIGDQIEVPCGRCIGCRLEYSRQWAIRCMHEASMHDDNAFITLTYDDKYLPPRAGLDPDHWTRFMKRFRKRIAPQKVRFFMCGEYGEICEVCNKSRPTRPAQDHQCKCSEFVPMLGRPHFHALIFGWDPADKYLWTVRNNNRVYRSETLEKTWYFGNSEVGAVTFDSAAYVARYCLKKRTSRDGNNDHYRAVDSSTGEQFTRHPEFCRMSRGGRESIGKPGGIGGSWYDTYKGDLRKDFITVRERPMRPPKYYDRQTERFEPERWAELVLTREEYQQFKDRSDDTPERLAVKEHIQLKRAKKLSRGYDNEQSKDIHNS